MTDAWYLIHVPMRGEVRVARYCSETHIDTTLRLDWGVKMTLKEAKKVLKIWRLWVGEPPRAVHEEEFNRLRIQQEITR